MSRTSRRTGWTVLGLIAAARVGATAVASSPAFDELAVRMSDPRLQVRVDAVRTLGDVGPSASLAVDLLVKALDDPARPVREAAADSLGRLGPRAVRALPALLQAFRTEHGKPQPPPPERFVGDPVTNDLWRFIAAIKALGPESASAFICALGDPDRAVRHGAIRGISATPLTSSVRQALIEVARHEVDPRLMIDAIGTLGQRGAVEDLVRAANGVPLDDVRLRMLLLYYADIEPNGRMALAVLARDPREQVRNMAKSARSRLR